MELAAHHHSGGVGSRPRTQSRLQSCPVQFPTQAVQTLDPRILSSCLSAVGPCSRPIPPPAAAPSVSSVAATARQSATPTGDLRDNTANSDSSTHLPPPPRSPQPSAITVRTSSSAPTGPTVAATVCSRAADCGASDYAGYSGYSGNSGCGYSGCPAYWAYSDYGHRYQLEGE